MKTLKSKYEIYNTIEGTVQIWDDGTTLYFDTAGALMGKQIYLNKEEALRRTNVK